MIPLSLREIATVVGGRVEGDGNPVIREVAVDSRQVSANALFVALPGEHADGHDYAAAAVQAGAVAVMASRRPAGTDSPLVLVDDTWRALRELATEVRHRVDPTVVAITGSVGKTTAKDLIGAALATDRPTVAAQGSFNNELGVPLTLLRCTEETQALVTELGARHVGDLALLAPGVAPDISVVTAVAGVHLEVFGSIEAVATAKAELVEALGPDGLAVLNADDPRVAAMAERAPEVLWVGVHNRAEVTAEQIRLDHLARPSFVAVTPWGRTAVRLQIAGRHHVHNGLYALAVAGHLGADLSAAAAALEQAPVSRWRGEVVDTGELTIINDAYNASPTSVLAALDTLCAIDRPGRRWAVLGYMAEIGSTEEQEHRRVGAAVTERGVDHLVVVGAQAGALADGAAAAGLPSERLHRVPDAAAAVDLLRDQVAPQDVILVKASRVAALETVADALASGAADTEDLAP